MLTTAKYCEWTQDSCINTLICILEPALPEPTSHIPFKDSSVWGG